MGVTSRLVPLISSAARVVRLFPGGTSLIDGGALVFALHRVSPLDPRGLQSNENLKVTPGYLEFLVRTLRAAKYRIVPLDDLVYAATATGSMARMVCLTFDDGYLDNLANALPLLERHEVPFTVYIASAMADGTAFVWWLALGNFLLQRTSVRLASGRELSCRTMRERESVFLQIRRAVIQNGELEPGTFLLEMVQGFESALPLGSARRYMMDWTGVRKLAESPFATVGCHTATHTNLRSLTEERVRQELSTSKARIEDMIGRKVKHLAFPFGGPEEAGEREYRLASEAGFVTAATAIPGSVGRGELDLFHCLPRVLVREGTDPERLIAENRARVWLAGLRRFVSV